MRKAFIYALMLQIVAFVIMTSARAGERGEKALDVVVPTTFEETFTADEPETYSSMYPECTEEDWQGARAYCMSHGYGYPLQNYSCEVLSDGRAHYSCNYQIPLPYQPPCFWNCRSGGRISAY